MNAVERKRLLDKAKPIVFRKEMMQSLSVGIKCTTRIVIDVEEGSSIVGMSTAKHPELIIGASPDGVAVHKLRRVKFPYYANDILYVQEDMPKENARFFLKVKNVYIEPLQEINQKRHDEILKEGWPFGTSHQNQSPMQTFREYWDSTLRLDELNRYGWDANPYVFVVEFEPLVLNK